MDRLSTVIYATDFSASARNAGAYAALIASHFSARLLVAHAFTLSQAAMEAEADGSKVSRQRQDLELLLSQKAQALAPEPGKAVPVLLQGEPKKVLPALADQHAPSIIVMGTHGGNWVERGIVGSVAEEILRSTGWPTLTVGPHVKAVLSEDLLFRRILCVADSGLSAARVAAYAVSFAEAFRAEIDVLNVVRKESMDHSAALLELRDRFYAALQGSQALQPRQAEEFSDLETFVEVGKAHQKILQHIKDRPVDLMVLGIQRASHLGLEVRTSGAFRLIVESTCPVLTITG